MRVLVFSDSHYSPDPMIACVREQKPDAVLFLGDGLRDLAELRREFPALDIRAVRGNCDFGYEEDEVLTPVFGGVRIFMTHGHRYHVKYTLEPLANAAHFSQAPLALFGHTHHREYQVMGDVTVFNPGAVGQGGMSGGQITIEGGKFQCRFLDL